MMFDTGIHNDFEEAHQKGLNRGFDLGWTYKGQFDRSIIRSHVDKLSRNKNVNADKIKLLEKVLKDMIEHPCNIENKTK